MHEISVYVFGVCVCTCVFNYLDPRAHIQPRGECWIFYLFDHSLFYYLKAGSLTEPGRWHWTLKLLGFTCLCLASGLAGTHIPGLVCSGYLGWNLLNILHGKHLTSWAAPRKALKCARSLNALSITRYSIFIRAYTSQALPMTRLCKRRFISHTTQILSAEGHIEKPIKVLKQMFTRYQCNVIPKIYTNLCKLYS
jgi:hypothetical protein